MQHLRYAGGLTCMEVDHFDPQKKNDTVQDYENLFLASRHCNRAKGMFWSTDEEASQDMRLLNLCEEADYGEHIFEDASTAELVGATPPGRTQIRICDLNAPHLVEERKLRAAILAYLAELKSIARSTNVSLPAELFAIFAKATDFMIPPIPPP